ncbi:hypothetical protein N7468_001057 [Penicillium chermesinum]|uniref:Uncharacterized protein n=1 Tax=Penicillium chermesinum TaxID=63820 RepID=A0A9W9PG56_9EURO|nr:uncharacterized protein N7468_001057 [Penicillium chermesinum]KAJ5246074.1 hypothetical protein N7468_001057 [Penicillium chermesinum]
MTLASTLLALPVLCLVSIPLILSAWVTISLALVTLFVRLLVVYLGVGYDMCISFFTMPISTISFLTFAVSQPPTPATGNSRRNSGAGPIAAFRSDDPLSKFVFSGLDDVARYNRNKNMYARTMAEAHNLSTSPPMGLPVSGDEWRDFEGVGGWRSYHDGRGQFSSRRSSQAGQEKPLSPASTSSTQSIIDRRNDPDIDSDDRDWLSLNHRLELPSQIFTLGSFANSPTQTADTLQSRRANFHLNIRTSANSSNMHQDIKHKHHHRSQTTSALPHPNSRTTAGLSLALSKRPGISSPPSRELDDFTAPSTSRFAPFMTPQLHARPSSSARARAFPMTSAQDAHLSNSLEDFRHNTGLSSSATSSATGSGGYFALQLPGFSQNYLASPTPSGYTTPGGGLSSEDRDTSPSWARLIAHYPMSVRHRRRSISGPQARRMSIGERLA